MPNPVFEPLITDANVEEVRKRANVPRVRSSEVRRIMAAFAEISAERAEAAPAEF